MCTLGKVLSFKSLIVCSNAIMRQRLLCKKPQRIQTLGVFNLLFVFTNKRLTAKLKGNAHNKLRRGDDVEKQENTGLATGALSHLSAELGSVEFTEFPKMARLSRDVIVTEKLDGTNAQVLITEDGQILAGSRTRWITPQDDNFGFAAWVEANKEELLKLGVGRHFGEWWGMGIQRKYGMTERKFSLFNVQRWAKHGTEPKQIPTGDPRIIKMQDVLPACCDLVPVLYRGDFDTNRINECLDNLREFGSYASEGFMKPEGVVVFHTAGNVGFKKTLEKDEIPKSVAKKQAA